MTRFRDVSDRYVEDLAKADPIWATEWGIDGNDDMMTDYSVDAHQRRADLHRRTAQTVAGLSPENELDRIGIDVVAERIAHDLDWFDSGEHLCALSVMWSPAQSVRETFDAMPRDTNDQWRSVAIRMSKVAAVLQTYISGLRHGVQLDMMSSRRQALAVARQARTWAGVADGSNRYFLSLANRYETQGGNDRKITDALRKASVPADNAYADLASFLIDEYAPAVPDIDGVGRDRYELAASRWLGETIDPIETYEWGWSELHRIDDEVRRVCAEIAPGKSLHEVIQFLDEDHERLLHGETALVDWLQGLLDHTITRLDGTHFEIPTVLKAIEVRVPAPGGAEAPTYLPPSEDFRRPGVFWRPTGGRTRFPIWSEISVAYHEGVPGHHLQFGFVKHMHDSLSRYQRNTYVPGHAEGWALYAERLMDELGFLERPEYRLDMLLKSLWRAARVVIDIGLHLHLSIPADEPFHGGSVWSAELARQMLSNVTNLSDSMIASEVDRYLGVPAQAISYKVGERAWLEARALRQQRDGSAFDLKQFHHDALSLGPMGLAQLKRELS